MDFWQSTLFIILLLVDAFCLYNSGDLVLWLFKSRNQARVVRATFEVMCAVFMVAASIMLILITSYLWPDENRASTAPAIVQFVAGAGFFLAHISLAAASFRAKRFFMNPVGPIKWGF